MTERRLERRREGHPYFWHTRKGKLSLLTHEVAAAVAKGRRSWLHLDDETGRTVIWGYTPQDRAVDTGYIIG